MSANVILANVVFSAGWVAVGAAALWARHRKILEKDAPEAASGADAAPATAVAGDFASGHTLPGATAGTSWAKDLAALALAIDTAAEVPSQEREPKVG
jgi:hypothetical protein